MKTWSTYLAENWLLTTQLLTGKMNYMKANLIEVSKYLLYLHELYYLDPSIKLAHLYQQIEVNLNLVDTRKELRPPCGDPPM